MVVVVVVVYWWNLVGVSSGSAEPSLGILLRRAKLALGVPRGGACLLFN